MTVEIDVATKTKGGHTLVIIDGAFVGLDGSGDGKQNVQKPPKGHWYTVTLLGEPGDSCDYALTSGADTIDQGALLIADGDTFCSTSRVDFDL